MDNFLIIIVYFLANVTYNQAIVYLEMNVPMDKEWSIDIFTKNLKMYMEQFGKNQKEMAAIVGVSPPTFHNWLKGKKMPRMNNVQKLADYFGVKLSDLIEEKITTTIEKNSDTMVDITVLLGTDIYFRDIVKRNYYDRDLFELWLTCHVSLARYS